MVMGCAQCFLRCTMACLVFSGDWLHTDMDKRDSLVIAIRSRKPPSGELSSLGSVLSSPWCEQFVLNHRPSQGLAYRLQANYCPFGFPFLTLVKVQYYYELQWFCTLYRQSFAIEIVVLGHFWIAKLCWFVFTLNYYHLWLRWYCQAGTDICFPDWHDYIWLPFCSWICCHCNENRQSNSPALNIWNFVHLYHLKWPSDTYGPLSSNSLKSCPFCSDLKQFLRHCIIRITNHCWIDLIFIKEHINFSFIKNNNYVWRYNYFKKKKQGIIIIIKGQDILLLLLLFQSLVLFCKIRVHFHDKSCVKYSTNK